jgi:serine/threonine protein phosphatase PrpC
MASIKQVTQLHEVGIRPLNEDAVLINEKRGLFGVFDGASSLNSFVSPDGKTGAYIASHIAADTFLQSNKNLTESLETADLNIDRAHQELGVDTSDSVNRFSTTVAAIKVKNNQVELLQVGDSVIIVVYKDGHAEVPLGYHDHDIELMRKWRRLADEGKTNIRQIIAEDVILLRRSSNVGYGTLNGDGNSNKFMETSSIDISNLASIIIITDGMFIPKADPEGEDDWNYYAEIYKEGGLEKIYQTVRERERSDPELVKYPRYKLHDDASGIAVEFT